MIETIKNNFIFTIQGDEFKADSSTCSSLLKKISTSGSVSDLDYNSPNRDVWPVTEHLSMLAVICSNKNFAEKNIESILKAVDFFLDGNFVNSNWWHNEIGIQQNLGDVALCIEEHLSQTQKEKITAYLEKGSAYCVPRIKDWKGANLAWGVLNTIRHGLFVGNIEIIKLAVDLIQDEFLVKPGDRDGIKPDFGFTQHFTQFYLGGYGRSFIYTAAKIVYTLSGTDLQVDRKYMLDLGNYVIHGIAYCIQGHYYDYLTLGREICRDCADGQSALSTEVLRKALLLFIKTDGMYAADVMRNILPSLTFEGYSVVGEKYFEVCQYYASRKRGSHISSKLTSPNKKLGESINGENHLSCNMFAGGNTCIMVNGDEYAHLMPVFDYSRFPGTTAPLQSEDTLAKRIDNYHDTFGKNSYCGGYSFLNNGIAFQDINYGGVTGVVSRFFHNGNMVALGAGITSDTGEQIFSNINQCNGCEDYKVFDDDSVYHNRVGYFSLDENPIVSNIKEQTGCAKKNRLSSPDKIVSKKVFNAFFDHGVNPNNASYAYGVIPLTPFDGSEKFLKDIKSRITVLQNDRNIQAVQFENTVMIVFHKTGVFYLPDGTPVRSSERQGVIINL